MRYLFGNLLTRYAPASLNRGENDGNEQLIQQILWHNDPHTTISPFSIRWKIRYQFQEQEQQVYEKWDNIQRTRIPQSKQHNPQEYIDDDVMGFMVTEAGKNNQKGTSNARQGALGTNRAISLTPYDGTTFNYYNSGKKDKLSIHSTNVHNTCYQYCFALDSKHLINPSRILNVINAFISLSQVGGHINDSLFDFSPESMILRWTSDNCPRFLYCFEQDENQQVIVPKLIEQVEAEDIKPEELWIGGEITKRLNLEQAHIFRGIKATAEDIKQVITKDLKLLDKAE
ncbi:MAG: type I-B CRISPR-associated protein Cas7/Cst2/DevR [Oscillatoria sp. PMC 1068.18]|nr:type I-B CRISPR-associated protein Cas7/Cst2/DevR [Oscillatoria sp. PMC 1068.18]